MPGVCREVMMLCRGFGAVAIDHSAQDTPQRGGSPGLATVGASDETRWEGRPAGSLASAADAAPATLGWGAPKLLPAAPSQSLHWPDSWKPENKGAHAVLSTKVNVGSRTSTCPPAGGGCRQST